MLPRNHHVVIRGSRGSHKNWPTLYLTSSLMRKVDTAPQLCAMNWFLSSGMCQAENLLSFYSIIVQIALRCSFVANRGLHWPGLWASAV